MDRLGLAPCGVCRAALVTLRAVRSYRTFSPLPLRAVYFLWHFPWKIPRSFERHTTLWSPEVPLPAPKLAGSGYLAANYIIQKPHVTVGSFDVHKGNLFARGTKTAVCAGGVT